MKAPCPRCGAPMVEHQTKTALLTGCLQCGGVFVDHATRGRVVTQFDAEIVDATEMAAARGSAPVDVRTAVACPVCQRRMATQKLAGGVTIDVCDAHGAWFDRHELGQLVAALKAQRDKSGAGIGTAAAVGAVAVGAVAVGAVAVASASAASEASAAASSSGIGVGDVVDAVGTVFDIFDFFS